MWAYNVIYKGTEDYLFRFPFKESNITKLLTRLSGSNKEFSLSSLNYFYYIKGGQFHSFDDIKNVTPTHTCSVWIHLYFIYRISTQMKQSFEKLNIRCKGGNKDVTIGYVNKNYVSYIGTFTECDNLNADLQGRQTFVLREINFENLYRY